MAKSFNDSEGEAIKNKLEYVKLEFGTNKVRVIGPIIARYSYWKKLGPNNIPVECLAFDRDEEKFTNIEKDWFKHYFPKIERDGKMVDQYPTWSYVCMVIDPKENKIKLFGLKKKLWEQVTDLAKKRLGDPTDPETGWWLIFDKKKTGPLPFNVEYTLDQMACSESKGPLTEEEMEFYNDMPSIDDLVPRLTSDQQRQFIESAWINKEEENTDTDAVDALDEEEEDAPF